jgi:hypothetical protein
MILIDDHFTTKAPPRHKSEVRNFLTTNGADAHLYISQMTIDGTGSGNAGHHSPEATTRQPTYLNRHEHVLNGFGIFDEMQLPKRMKP